MIENDFKSTDCFLYEGTLVVKRLNEGLKNL